MFEKIGPTTSLSGDRSGIKPMLLSELISAVKADLLKSTRNRSDDFEALFQIEEVNIETEVTAERKIGAGGKTELIVATISADGEQTNQTKHKISIKLRLLEDKRMELIQGPGKQE
jgi:hypothetical protein